MELPATPIYRSCRGHVTYFSNVRLLSHLLKPWSWSWGEIWSWSCSCSWRKSLICITANNYYLPHSYSIYMGQIIKKSLHLSVCSSCALLRSHFLIDFHQNWHKCKNPKKEKWVSSGSACTVSMHNLVNIKLRRKIISLCERHAWICQLPYRRRKRLDCYFGQKRPLFRLFKSV